ncbi:MAG: LptA/OstA family protein [Desulfobacterales bacterium]
MAILEVIIKNGKLSAFPAVLSACIFFATVLTCGAQDPSGPMFDPDGGEIRITSEKMIMQSEKNTAEFIGNAHAVQGDTSVRSNVLKVFYKSDTPSGARNNGMNEESIERIEALEQVTIESKDTTAEAETAVYTSEDGLLTLQGNPARLKTKESVVTGEQITINRNTGDVEVHGDKNQRVEAVLKPASGSDSDKSEDQGRSRTD